MRITIIEIITALKDMTLAGAANVAGELYNPPSLEKKLISA